MKAGTDSKTKVYAAIVLGVVAILCVAWAVLPSLSSGNTPVAQPATTRAKAVPVESLDPRLRLDLLASSENVKYEGKGKNIFRVSMGPDTFDKVKVPPLSRDQKLAQGTRTNTPPPPPPINLKYFGSTNSKGEKPKAFLSQGDDVWIAHEGDVVNRHYRIIHISPRDIEVEDLLNNHRETIPLTQG